jgi:integrase
MAEKLTAPAVNAAKVKPDQRVKVITDGGCKGLELRVTDKGVKSWYFRFRLGSRAQQRKLIGHYPDVSLADAREAADEFRVAVSKGRPPVTEKEASPFQVGALTFDGAADKWIEQIKTEKKSWKQDQGHLKRARARWGKLPVKAVTTDMVVDLLTAIKKNGDGRGKPAPISANRTQSALHTLFVWAKQMRHVDSNPLTELPKIGCKTETPCERFLDDAELRVLWDGLDDRNLPTGRATALALKLILLTAQRPGEVANLRSEDVYSDKVHGNVWRLAGDDTKNGMKHWVPLTASALAVIREAEKLGGDVFGIATRTISQAVTGKDGEGGGKPRRGICDFLGMQPWTPHDLRRTAATMCGDAGWEDFWIDRLQNHKQKGMGRVYNHAAYLAEKREMVELIEARVAEVTGASRRGRAATPQLRRRTTPVGAARLPRASGMSRRRTSVAASSAPSGSARGAASR